MQFLGYLALTFFRLPGLSASSMINQNFVGRALLYRDALLPGYLALYNAYHFWFLRNRPKTIRIFLAVFPVLPKLLPHFNASSK